MKTIQSVVEVLLAIPMGILAVPLMLLAFTVKWVMPSRKPQAVVIAMDNRPNLARNAG
jgi:hypothetical protein